MGGEEIKIEINNQEVFRGRLDLNKLQKLQDYEDLEVGKCMTESVKLENQEILKVKCCRTGEKKFNWTVEGMNEKGEKESTLYEIEK